MKRRTTEERIKLWVLMFGDMYEFKDIMQEVKQEFNMSKELESDVKTWLSKVYCPMRYG